jgi:hypothetical protein
MNQESETVKFVHLGGKIGNEKEKSHNILNIHKDYLQCDATMAVILRSEKIVDYFGNGDNQNNKFKIAEERQEQEDKKQRYQTLLHMNNFIQYSFFDRSTKVMSLDHLRKCIKIHEQKLDGANDYKQSFHYATYAVKQMSMAIDVVEQETEGEVDDNAGDGEEQDDPLETMLVIQEKNRELRDLLKEVPS